MLNLPGVPTKPWFRPVRLAALLGMAYLLTAHLSVELSALTGDVAAVWPPNGIVMAALLVSPIAYWPSYALATLVAVVAVNLLHGDSVVAGFGFALANLAELMLAAALLCNCGVGSTILESVRNVLIYVTVTVLAAAVGASLGAAVVSSAYGGSYWSVWLGWWIADLLGLLIVTPMLTAWWPLLALRRPTWARTVEASCVLTGTGATAFAAFGGVSVPPLLWPVLLFLVVPFQIWAAARLDWRVAATASLLVLLGGVAGLKTGGTSIPGAEAVADGLLLLQAVLALTSINAMTLAAAFNQRRRAETGAQAAEARLRDAVDNMSDGFELYDADGRLELYNDRGKELLSELADVLIAGASYEDVLRSGAVRGLYLDAVDRTEEWISERLRRHHDPSDDYELRLTDGRCLLIRERRTDEGGTVTIRSDITQLKLQEQIRLQQVEERRRLAEAERLAEALREREAVARGVLDTALDAYVRMDQHGRITEWNVMAERTFGWARGEAIGRRVEETIIPPVQREAHRRGLARFFATGEAVLLDRRIELQALHRSGREFPIELTIVGLQTDRGQVFSAFIRDLTEKKHTEEQLRQMQKMEAVGQLTGGVAHDFNNLLAVIIGSLDLASESVAGEPSLAAHMDRALGAAEKGAALTRSLLAFSRQQALQAEQTDLNQTVAGMIELLRSTVGEHVEVDIRPNGDLWPALADKSQLESALLNLALNSRDAMPDGGKLTVGTANVTLDAAYAAQNPGVEVGDYVMLAVTDTGTGMPLDVVERAFEPFFTTKGVGKGSGLGLSMIHGFARQSGGHLKIHSEVGHGTTVRLYLPRMRAAIAAVPDGLPEPVTEKSRNARILVVEDSPAVRQVVANQLRSLGHQVLEAENAAAALRLLTLDQAIDLLFTDMVMPGGMTGLQLAERAEELRPGLKVLFTSGFAEVAVQKDDGSVGHQLLSKPYRIQDLARSIQEVLGETVEAMPRKPRLLMIDDARDIGAFVRRVAEAIGYDMEFTDRADGFEARYQSLHPEVVILDLTLPGTDGTELLSFLATEGSSAQILLMSGSDEATRDSALRFGVSRGLCMAGTVPKPVRAGELRSILKNLM